MIAADIGGQLGTTYEVANYPGFEMITGPDLVARFEAQAEQYGIDKLVGEQVVGLRENRDRKVVLTASGRELYGQALILATGAQKRKLGIPGENELAGRGVVYCSTCDGPLFKGDDIAIVGGGNSGLEAALEMAGVARRVYLIAEGELSGDRILIDKVEADSRIEVLTHHRPGEIRGGERVDALKVQNRETGEQRLLEVDGVFIEIGLTPNAGFAYDLLGANARGELEADPRGNTVAEGVFAAGDVTDNPSKQVVIAAASGANAALGLSSISSAGLDRRGRGVVSPPSPPNSIWLALVCRCDRPSIPRAVSNRGPRDRGSLRLEEEVSPMHRVDVDPCDKPICANRQLHRRRTVADARW